SAPDVRPCAADHGPRALGGQEAEAIVEDEEARPPAVAAPVLAPGARLKDMPAWDMHRPRVPVGELGIGGLVDRRPGGRRARHARDDRIASDLGRKLACVSALDSFTG